MLLSSFLISFLAGISTIFGGLIIFFKFKKENINKFITASLAFSLVIMIGISITDLIPESSHILLINLGIIKGISLGMLTIGSGIILTKVLDCLIKKQELKHNDLYKLGILNMIALILHNFPEGIVTFMSSYQNINIGIKLAIGIAFHNIPEGISIAIPIYYATKSKNEALFKTLLSGLAEPIGAILAYIFLSKYITDTIISLILLLVAGIMVTLAIENIFPKAKQYNENKYLILGLIIGLVLIILNLALF